MGHRIAGVWHPEDGDFEYRGLWYPDGEEITKHMAERLAGEPFYQADKVDAALAQVKGFRVAVDCGAWVGAWTRELTRRFERAIAIELSADNVRCVRKNAPRAEVLHCALGDINGMATPAKAKFDSHVSWQVGERMHTLAQLPGGVRMRRLEAIPEIEELPCLDYLKIHVNGYEVRALRGALSVIQKHRPIVTLVLKRELATYGDTPEAAREMLSKVGYVPIGGEKPYEIFGPG